MSSIVAYRGRITTYADAIIILEACRLGILPMVTHRLSDIERHAIRCGDVFVFSESVCGIKRWSDGRLWSSSRVKECFLIYIEIGFSSTISGFKQPQISSLSRSDMLRKKVLSVSTPTGQRYRLVAYSDVMDDDSISPIHSHISGQLPRYDPQFRNLPVPPGFYRSNRMRPSKWSQLNQSSFLSKCKPLNKDEEELPISTASDHSSALSHHISPNPGSPSDSSVDNAKSRGVSQPITYGENPNSDDSKSSYNPVIRSSNLSIQSPPYSWDGSQSSSLPPVLEQPYSNHDPSPYSYVPPNCRSDYYYSAYGAPRNPNPQYVNSLYYSCDYYNHPRPANCPPTLANPYHYAYPGPLIHSVPDLSAPIHPNWRVPYHFIPSPNNSHYKYGGLNSHYITPYQSTLTSATPRHPFLPEKTSKYDKRFHQTSNIHRDRPVDIPSLSEG